MNDDIPGTRAAGAPRASSVMSRSGPASMGRLTAGKAVANTALRWVPPFLPTLEKAFGATTTQMTTILGVGELAGLSTIVVGRHLDRGRERAVTILGLTAIAVASLVALAGTTFTFAIGSVLVVFGVGNCTVAGHAFIGRRVPYERRARSIGLFETSWALALLAGAPTIAVLIWLFGWRGPYVALTLAATGMALVITRSTSLLVPPTAVPDVPGSGDDPPAQVLDVGRSADVVRPSIGRMTVRAWLVIVGAALLATAGLSIFTISGSWLDDAFGVSTGGLGAVAMGFGAIELLSTLSSATFADRFGKLRSILGAIGLLLAGLVVMSIAGSTLWIGVVGILGMLCGFEFAIVTSFSLVSEAMPAARGTTIALSNAVATIARGGGTILGGWLYGIHGIEGSTSLSAIAAVLAVVCLLASRRVPDR